MGKRRRRTHPSRQSRCEEKQWAGQGEGSGWGDRRGASAESYCLSTRRARFHVWAVVPLRAAGDAQYLLFSSSIMTEHCVYGCHLNAQPCETMIRHLDSAILLPDTDPREMKRPVHKYSKQCY